MLSSTVLLGALAAAVHPAPGLPGSIIGSGTDRRVICGLPWSDFVRTIANLCGFGIFFGRDVDRSGDR